ncbi:hypothetical protein [Providencia sp. PROV147]|uniref:hypothetical protein n=1 Tax=Providencia sp. PROV147 TaxID=2949857 RepID=UPI001E597E18|nr:MULTISPECIES: hypothetical protein [Providencia]UFK95921.1 hypothetical protein LMY39_07030 [Providencia rettgeri]
MAKTATERNADQRKRQREFCVTKTVLFLNEQESEMHQRNCALRRPEKEPYNIAEYLSILIKIDDRSVMSLVSVLNKRHCKRYNEQLPVAECCLCGSSEC